MDNEIDLTADADATETPLAKEMALEFAHTVVITTAVWVGLAVAGTVVSGVRKRRAAKKAADLPIETPDQD